MKDDTVGAGLIRVRHVGRTISGGPKMTEENIKIAVHALRRGSRAQRASQQVVHVPKEALAAVGAASKIVLRRKHQQ